MNNANRQIRVVEKPAYEQSIVGKLASLAIRQSSIHDSRIVYEAIEVIEKLQESQVRK